MSARALVVSIHDVSPRTREAVTRILAELGRVGIQRTSLLVVPDHHHAGNITGDADFCGWLRGLVAVGHEPVLHGFYHQRERRVNESALTQFVTRHYTAGEGEFFDISFDEARTSLVRGRDDLTRCAGIVPSGFIAPAWLLSAEGEAAAKDVGFAYTTRLKSVSDLARGSVCESQSLCWSVRTQWRRTMSIAWNKYLVRTLRENPLLRISIHPPDMDHPAIWRQVERLAGHAAQNREAITYQEFVLTRRHV